jgi:Ser/Thr protein kinase RdoA (MazF antagonist)
MSKEIKIPQEVLNAFGYNNGNKYIEQNYDGLINATFFVEDKNSKIVLQKINQSVFKNAEFIQFNYEKIYNYIQQNAKGFLMPRPVFTNLNSSFFIDAEGGFWRAFTYVNNSLAKHFITDEGDAYTVAALFGRLLKVLAGFPASHLQHAIPDFHNLHLRYKQFEKAVQVGDENKKREAVHLIESLQKRRHYVALFDDIANDKDKFPIRVLHHDAKVANILFDKITGEVLCAVDFDTLMPGYFFSDFGDMVRASASSAGEEETDFSRVFINQEYFDALLKGYLAETKDILTESEKSLLVYSGHILVYMQSLRFTTDYLLGDIYYKTSYTNHNFNRAMNQLVLLQSLEKLVPETAMVI